MPIEMTCENCKQPFYCYESEAQKGRKFCSLACRGNHRANRKPPAGQTPVAFTCRECQKPFTMMQSYLTAYRKKFDRDPLYCSMSCSDAGRRKDTEARNKFRCVNCGKEGLRHRNASGRVYVEQKLCSKQCKSEWIGKQYHAHRGTVQQITRRAKRRYVELRIPASNGKPVRHILEHRYVMEQALGRELYPEETVHHVNGDRHNNALSNLELFSSRHGPGQRIVDKVAFAIEILRLYPEFAKAAGVELRVHESSS